MSERYLVPENIPAYIDFVRAELGEQVAIYLRPQRWLSADLGPAEKPGGLGSAVGGRRGRVGRRRAQQAAGTLTEMEHAR